MKNTRASLKPLNLKDVSKMFFEKVVNLSIKLFISILTIELFLNILYTIYYTSLIVIIVFRFILIVVLKVLKLLHLVKIYLNGVKTLLKDILV